MCFAMAAAYASAQEGAAEAAAQPAPAQQAAEQAPAAVSDEETPIANIPATSYWGVRGLSQTVSAEPLGEGRLNIAIFGSGFNQKQNLGSPKKGTNVGLGRIGGAYGLNDNWDLFGLLPMNYVQDRKDGEFNPLPELVGGVQVSYPFPEESLFRLAGQIQLIWGLSKNDTLTYNPYNDLAGYDYFETRGTIDIVAKVAQSIILNGQSQRRAVKFHFNEGISFVTGKEPDLLLLLAAGLQVDPIEFLTVGLEVNSRSTFKSSTFKDPFWLTPTVMYRSPWFFGALAGIDITISEKHETHNTKPLECYRIFGDIVLSLDLNASKRAAEAQRKKEAAAEKARLEAETKRLASEKDNIAQKAVEDSIRAAEEMAKRAEADSLRTKAVADSLSNLVSAISQQAQEREAMILAEAAAKRAADSVARVDLEKKLSEEKAKRSEAEQYLLTTGMLVLDAVYFSSGKADLHINSRPYLGTIAKMLVKYPKLKLEIGGHTDNIGRFETNMNLSQKRAEAVFLQMINVEPSLAQMLTSRGYGSTVPKANNSTAGGRELNRRVELKVLNPEVLKDYNP
jgi:outer membrane protein OmpA-like peptidoglycan-associated protein